jgi:hypothetical protein
MSFLNPIFLLGIAALASPFLVHLVWRTKAKRVEFPTLFFVRQIPQRTIRHRNLHNLLLLLLRSLALFLLVLAFTRPYLTSNNTVLAGAVQVASVVLLDTSYSMRVGERFTQARKHAQSIINGSQDGEQVSIVTFSKDYQIVSRFTSDKSKLQSLLSTTNAGWNGTDYEQALRGVEPLFAEIVAAKVKRIYLISDFQSSGWKQQENVSFQLRKDIQLIPVDVNQSDIPANVAITDVDATGVVYGPKYTGKLTARINNFSQQAYDRLPFDFKINDQTVEKREVSLSANDYVLLEFTGFNLSAGDNRCVMTINSEDFIPDNKFYFTLRRESQIPALIVDEATRGRNESLYLLSALTTGDNLPFTVQVKTAGAVDPTELNNYSVIILNGVGSISNELAKGINNFVIEGGKLIISAGRAGDVNQILQPVIPARLGNAVELKRGEETLISNIKNDHPIFGIFKDDGQLSTARIFGYRRAEPVENSSTLAWFEDGSPALIEFTPNMKGKVLLFTSTFSTQWTDMPLTPLYLPFIQQLIRYLSMRETDAWYQVGNSIIVPRLTTDKIPAVDTPSNTRLIEQSITPTGDLIFTAHEQGFYQLRHLDQMRFAAVNLDGEEADFSKLNVEEFIASFTNSESNKALTGIDKDAKLNAEEIEARQRIWWPLIIISLLLFIAEALLARRTKTAKMIGQGSLS